MNWLYILVSVIIYSLYAGITYGTFKESRWFLPVGLILGSLSNVFWLMLSRRLQTHAEQFFWALLWDSVIVATFIAVPMIFFGLRLTTLGYVGVALTVTGLILTKVATS